AFAAVQLLPQVQVLGLSLAQIRRQRFDQIQQQANAFAGTFILDAGEIDITKNLINRADSGLATHPVQRKTTGAVCPEKSNKNNQKCSSAAVSSLPPASVRPSTIRESLRRYKQTHPGRAIGSSPVASRQEWLEGPQAERLKQ